jgi:hypothetical protein
MVAAVMGVSTLRDLTTVLVQVDMSLVVMRELALITMNVPAIMVAVVTVATIPKDLTTALAPVATN